MKRSFPDCCRSFCYRLASLHFFHIFPHRCSSPCLPCAPWPTGACYGPVPGVRPWPQLHVPTRTRWADGWRAAWPLWRWRTAPRAARRRRSARSARSARRRRIGGTTNSCAWRTACRWEAGLGALRESNETDCGRFDQVVKMMLLPELRT